MPRYQYHLPYRPVYRYACSWWPQTDDLMEACAMARAKHVDALVHIDAECLIEGAPDIARVLIEAKYTAGKALEQICKIIDHKIDGHIVSLDDRSPAPRIHMDCWPNYRKLAGRSILPLVDKFILDTQVQRVFDLPVPGFKSLVEVREKTLGDV